MRRGQTFATAVAVVCVLAGCSPESGETGGPAVSASGPLGVYTVNRPLAYFAQRIGGDAVAVSFPAPPGVDPAFWSPSPDTILRYQQADLILLNGAGYAAWTARATLPRSRSVDTSAAHPEKLIPLRETLTHRHGPTGDHTHEGMAFTTWLDPELAIGQTRAIAAALSRTRPDHASAFESRQQQLEAELHALDQRQAAAARRIGGEPLLFSHPVYDYWIRRYGLSGRSLHLEPDTAPSPRAWREFDALLDEHPARWLIWEGQPLAGTLAELARRGVSSVVIDPAGATPTEPRGDFLAVMTQNATAMERIAASR